MLPVLPLYSAFRCCLLEHIFGSLLCAAFFFFVQGQVLYHPRQHAAILDLALLDLTDEVRDNDDTPS